MRHLGQSAGALNAAPGPSNRVGPVDRGHATSPGPVPGLLSDGLPGGQAPDRDVIRRTVVQSNWLRFVRGDAGVTIEGSERVAGPYEPVGEKGDNGYRTAAERELGDSTILDELARYRVIQAPIKASRPAYARSHLIGGAFGGQRQFPRAADNIRYHPDELEDGDWQQAELQVLKRGECGYLTVRSDESGQARVKALAAGIRSLVDAALPAERANSNEWGTALAHALRGSAYVPDYVQFSYTDVNGNLSFVREWSDLDRGLDMDPGATPDLVLRGLQAAQRRVPDCGLPDWLARVQVGAGGPALHLGSRGELLQLIRTLDVRSDTRENLVTSWNKVVGGPAPLIAFVKRLRTLGPLRTVEITIDERAKEWGVIAIDETRPAPAIAPAPTK